MNQALLFTVGGVAALFAARWLRARLLLSSAKHPSLRGHARLARRVARWVPFYEYDEAGWVGCDGAPPEVQQQRRQAFDRLASYFQTRAPRTLAAGAGLGAAVADVDFVDHYRVPFQFRNLAHGKLPLGHVVAATKDRRLQDLDGNWSLDLTGGYGVNLFGYELYKRCIARGERNHFRRRQHCR